MRVFLDVDGVLNAVGGCRWPDRVTSRAMGFQITWSPTVIKFICELAADPNVDVCWLTTWEHNANTEICPMVAMPELEVIDRAPYETDDPDNWWKLAAVQAYHETYMDEPFVWLDDDIGADFEAVEWLKGLPEGTFLAISPRTDRGLEEEHLRLVRTFVQGGKS